MNKRVLFSPEGEYERAVKVGRNKKRVTTPVWSFKLSEKSSLFMAARFVKNLGAKMSKAVRLMSSSNRKRASCKVSSASLVRTRSYAETLVDSQRAEAIEDCIEFLNSSSSLPRSSSVSSSF
ncbi:PREDICTED: josephin-like protein [Ipomoea nil]|uniref:josephin-like protein n=1 Tax=Ipomoea nil TaxID=35883 RepID=UPI00090098C3|nr:PREDICTED: josephin-like protein [Ipomoea nil]